MQDKVVYFKPCFLTFVTSKPIHLVTILSLYIYFPDWPPQKEKKKDLKIIMPPNMFFSKIRIKPVELAFKTLGICHVCIFFKKP
jgi:hypothetical protein